MANQWLAYHVNPRNLASYQDAGDGTITLRIEAYFRNEDDMLRFERQLIELIHNDVNPDSIQKDISTFVWSSLQLKAVYPGHYEHLDSPPQSMISESIIGYDDELLYYQLVAIPPFGARPRRCHLVDDCLCKQYEQYKYLNQVDYADDNLIALPTQIHDYFDGTGWITEFRFLPFLTLHVCFRC
jgi:hypothetical protein